MPQTLTFEEFTGEPETSKAQTFEAFVGEPRYVQNIQTIFARTEELQKDTQAQQTYIHDYWKQQGAALAKSDAAFRDDPIRATTHLLQTVGRKTIDQVQTEKAKEWQTVAKDKAVGEFFGKRKQLANALWNQVHLSDPEISDSDAYKYMHQQLEMYGYQPPGAGKLPPLVMQEGQWENAYTLGWTEFRSLDVGIAKGMYKLIHMAPELHVMAGEAVHDAMHQETMGAEVHGTNTYRDARHRMEIDERYFDQYLKRGMGEIPYLPPGFNIYEIIGEQLPQFTLMAGTGQAVASGLVTKFLGRTATASTMFALETTDAYKQYMQYAADKGMDPRTASQIAAGGAVAYGAIASVLETYGPFELLSKKNPRAFGRIARGAIMSLAEGGTEFTQAMTQHAIAEGLDLKDMDWDSVRSAMGEAVAGMIMGGAVGVARPGSQVDKTTPPQIAGPGMNIDPGDMGPATEVAETPTVTSEVVPTVTPGVTLTVTPKVEAPQILTREQIVDQMVEATPEADRTSVTRAAFEANLMTFQHSEGPFVEIEVPVADLDILQVTEEELGPKVEEYATRPAEEAPAIVAGTTAPGGRLTVIDGVHRVRAAQQRGDATIKTLIPQADADAIRPTGPEVTPSVEPVVAPKSFETWIEDQAEVTMRDLMEDPALRYEYEQEYQKQQVPMVVEAPVEVETETKLVKKSISLVQKKLGREGSKITDSKSLAEVGMAIAEIVGIDPEVDITWQFKTNPNQIGEGGTHWKERDGSHKIVITHGTRYRKGAEITPRIAARKSQAGMKVGQVTPSKTALYRVIVHELGHLAKAPTQTDMGAPRKIHHDEFVKWVEEGVSKLIGTTYVEAPVVDPLVSPENVPMAEDAKPLPEQPEGEAPQTVGGVMKSLLADEGGYLDTVALHGAISGGINVALEDIGSTWRGIKSLTDESAPLRKTDAGIRVMEVMDAAQSKAQAKIGEHNAAFLRAYDKLTTEEKRWLETFRDDGWTNWATLREHPDRLDAASIPRNVITLAQVAHQQQIDSAQGAIDARLPQARTETVIGPRGGKTLKRVVGIFKPAKEGRYYRLLTPAGSSAIENQAGDVFDALMQWHEEHADRNPDLPLTTEELKRVIQGERRSGKTRQAGSLEHTRIFKELPQAVKVNGKWVPIMESRPINHFMNSNESQWRRIAFWDVVQNRLLGLGRYHYGEYNEKTGEYELAHPDNKELTDIDGLIDRLRTDLVREEAMRKYGSPEGIKRTFKRALDNYFRQFAGGMMEEVFAVGDHHNRVLQGLGVLDRIKMSSMLSFSGLWDLMQSTASTHIVGIKNLLEAHAKVLSNPKKYAAEYQAIGAVMLRHHDYMLRKTRKELTGGLLERVVPQALMSGAEIAEKYAQTVTATAYDIWADRINGHLKDRQARELRTDLRLTDAEILEVAQGNMSAATKSKIIQNGVKTTNYLAEDPMHRGILQNNGLLRLTVPFTSVMSGSWRAAQRLTDHIAADIRRIKQGDKKATQDLIRSLGGMLTFIVGCFGRGFVQNMLRRLITGRPLIRPEEEDDWAGTLVECLGEGAVFGPYWRLMEVAKYSGGDPHRMAVNMLPRVSIWLDTISALGGLGKYENTSWGKRMAKRGYEISPAARSMRNWYSNLLYPGRAGFEETRQRVRMFAEEKKKEPITRHAYAIFEAVRDQDDTALDSALTTYKEWAKARGRTSEEARTALRAALYARRPMPLSAERVQEFLAGLSEVQRQQAEQQQREYIMWMDRVTQRPGVKRKRKKAMKRKKRPQGGDWYGTD